MRILGLLATLCVGAGVGVWACSSEVETTPPMATTGTGGAGGEAGAGPMSSSSTGMDACSNPENDCDDACCKIEVECGFGSSGCSLAESFLPCSLETCDPQCNCIADCLNDPAATCSQIAGLASMECGAPTPLAECAFGCVTMNSCVKCGAQCCATELQACANDRACTAFLQCAGACADGDGPCINTCAETSPSDAVDDLLTCTCTGCALECESACNPGVGGAGGGIGGAGGAGGAGGQGGN